MQPSLFASVQWTVSSLTKYIRERLESDARLEDVWVEGEISNLSRPASGHLYFTLKDAGAALRCVIWKSTVPRLGTPLQDGLAAAVHGKIGVYEAGGQYQLYADQVRPAGAGVLFQEFLRLKAALEAEGLFASERKRPVPPLPSRIGIVTSPTGAAVRDVLNTLRRRLPMVEVILAPSQVQGIEAPGELVEGLKALNRVRPRLDVILLVRGGGSIEDLWAFNDERVVRAVAGSEVPVICGVGHETDFTLSDFAADLRAPTPTAAAELATPATAAELREQAQAMRRQLEVLTVQFLSEDRNAVRAAAQELRFQSPMRRIESARQALDESERRIRVAEAHHLALEKGALAGWWKRLEALNPMEILGRGYAVVTRRADGVMIRRVSQARDGIRVRVSDGTFDADVASRRS